MYLQADSLVYAWLVQGCIGTVYSTGFTLLIAKWIIKLMKVHSVFHFLEINSKEWILKMEFKLVVATLLLLSHLVKLPRSQFLKLIWMHKKKV